MPVVQEAQLFHRAPRHVTVGPDREPSSERCKRPEREQSVPEVRLGRRAQPRHRPPAHHPGHLGIADVRAVNRAPPFVDGRVVEKPLDRPRLAGGQTVPHLLLLLGHVDMHGRSSCRHRLRWCTSAARVRPAPAGHEFTEPRERLARNRPQAVERPPQLNVGRGRAGRRPGGPRHLPAKRLVQPRRPLQIHPEAPLAPRQRLAAEAARLVHHGHVYQADPRGARRGNDPSAHLGRIVVAPPVRPTVQIVELADAGEARLEHLDVQLGRDRLHVVRGQVAEERVHHLAPAPERIRPAPLREPRQGALERMAVDVGDPGNRPPRHRLASAAAARLHRRDAAALVHLDHGVAPPAVPDQEPFEAERAAWAGPRWHGRSSRTDLRSGADRCINPAAVFQFRSNHATARTTPCRIPAGTESGPTSTSRP